MQTVAPSSIAAWFQSAWRQLGSSAAGSIPMRPATRRTLVSTAAIRSPKANEATAAAV